ncbi:MAG: xanthine dehydrogenase accessory protein XdhC [Zoogloeaceae bacterium]|nr:xanthine dehydrogenase accessory protein XdhC [Zoogloeaceae bacterium]
MPEWVRILRHRLASGTPVVRLAVATVRGSAPRDPGATLLCWREEAGRPAFWGSIGGGRLEARALEIAAQLLDGPSGIRRAEHFSLGATLGQCCGGVVELFWERFDSVEDATARLGPEGPLGGLRYCALGTAEADRVVPAEEARAAGWPAPPPGWTAGFVFWEGCRWFVESLDESAQALWLYGAGHVGSALVRHLTDLPFRIAWVDSRPEWLRSGLAALARPGLVGHLVEAPEDAADEAPADAWHLVMTHCHDLDLRICEAVLTRGDFGFLGLIGSRSKAARFRQRLAARAYAPDRIERLVCPVGLTGIGGKEPAAIAIAIAAQLLQLRAGPAAIVRPLQAASDRVGP